MQVALHEADRDVCRFLWKEPGKDEPMKAYRLTRVCFSLTCSPYLAMQMIRLRTDTRLRTLAIRRSKSDRVIGVKFENRRRIYDLDVVAIISLESSLSCPESQESLNINFSKRKIICKERLNQLFEEIDQLCVGPAEVELELSLEEEERMMAEDDWSKYQKGFRERKARALALRSNGSEQSG
ncbi:hypothetical protein T12_6497 [Trichinella patagoniensis]|uniref:Uncharacterized protein n=1 Tax=Trichinella patagoniensis TaxID=990121 RepID=A0A0V0ZNS3_9BILA|nr:hypothetical protein T12_6497 [Trichinella patagoniensis]